MQSLRNLKSVAAVGFVTARLFVAAGNQSFGDLHLELADRFHCCGTLRTHLYEVSQSFAACDGVAVLPHTTNEAYP